MAMFTKLLLVWTAVAMVATALVVSPNITSRPTRFLHQRGPPAMTNDVYLPNFDRVNEEDGRRENTYNAQQMDQYRQGHMEALELCRTVIGASTRQANRFNRIFHQYVPPTDRELVLGVFRSILGPEGKGNPKFVDIDLVDDFPPSSGPRVGEDEHCDGKHITHVALTVPKEDHIPGHRTQIILCPDFFLFGTIKGGKGKEWPGTAKRKCDNIGDRVSEYMLTLGTVMLHEYTHAPDLVQPPLDEETDDHAYSFYDSRNLRKDMAKNNADSYSLFAIELMWTLECNRDFAPPVKDNTPRLPATGAQAGSSKASGSKGPRPRHDIQLLKRTPLPRDYGVRTPNTLRINQETHEPENTYTAQQIEQFQEGHKDALMMCRTVIEQATKTPDRFNRIFRAYFPFSDRKLIIDVFKSILDADREGKGNPKLEDIDLVDDYPQPQYEQDLWCAKGDATALTLPKHADTIKNRRQLILCPSFWRYGTFEGGVHREWPNVVTRKCSNIAYRVSRRMETLGEVLLHEYTHIDEIVQPPLPRPAAVDPMVKDFADNFHDSRELALTDPGKAKYNADSYAKFATELTWSTRCKRDFEEPFEDNGFDSSVKPVGVRRQEPRQDIQLAPSLHKRTAFSQPYQHPIPKTNVDNTYTVEQMDQFLEGHIDALQLCRVAIKQSTKNPARFDKIFRQYFRPNDRELVISVFKTILDIRGTNQGSPKLSVIEFIDDFKPDEEVAKKHKLPKDRHCRPKSYALTSDLKSPTRMILCPMFFTRGTLGKSVTCDTIGDRVGPDMATRGHTVLHEYTHAPEVMQPIFGNGRSPKGRTSDHAYGFDGSRKLDKNYAWNNADSYAAFATELFWTVTCGRDFDPPLPVRAPVSPDELGDLLTGLDLGRTGKGESSAQGASKAKGDPSAKRDLAAEDDSAAKRDVAAKGASTVKGTPSTK